MTPETRRRIFRYGIAIDLVILATGVGLLVPESPLALTGLYVAAVALAAWKGGWSGAWTAIATSVALLSILFMPPFTSSHLIAFAAASIAASAIVRAGHAKRASRVPAAPENVVAFESAAPPAYELEQAARERQIVAKTLEAMAAQQLEAMRQAAAEQRRLAEEESRRAAEEALQRAEEEARQRREEERRAADEAAREVIEEERRRREAAEEVALRVLTEEQRRIEMAEEEAQRALAEERRRAEEAEEEARRVLADERRRVEEEARRVLADERRRIEEEARRNAEEERRRSEQQAFEMLEAERRAADAELQERLAAERHAIRARLEEQVAAERLALEKQAAEELAATRTQTAKPKKPFGPSLIDGVASTVSSWFRRETPARHTRVNVRKPIMAPPRASGVRRAPTAIERRPRLLMLERRRGTAETIAPKIRQQGVEIAIVERLVDAVDELFRRRPDVLVIDTELADFEKSYKSITEQNPNLPIALSARAAVGFTPPLNVRYVEFFGRPYEWTGLAALATKAMAGPEELLATARQRTEHAAPAPRPVSVSRQPASSPAPAPERPKPREQVIVQTVSEDAYEVICFNCRTSFDALDSDWCSCLTKERTMVCTNCLMCFCKAPPAYKETFWLSAPPRLFERKSSEGRRQQSGLPVNSEPNAVTRPLVLTVEDDEDIQAIIARVCANLGYGFIHAGNGLDGLALAREYKPNLILSDAFMPKLDGREMCRMLKEESPNADWRMVVMTGLYTDTKYRSEAVKRFHIDDYIAKPVAITELINLLQRHLDGVTGPPIQDVDLHELHRQDLDEEDEEMDVDEPEGIALADLLVEEQRREEEVILAPSSPAPALPIKAKEKPRDDSYEVCCFNCREMFDATRAEWCTCVGRDHTVVCTQCSGCFCKAPAAYKERFWMDAPPSLFERKMIGSKRNLGARDNPTPDAVKRPLILLVEDDENVQLIVKTVVTSMGYGFIAGANGQEGLALAREYNPDLILSDAFMPKLDGREMCRLLKEDPVTSRVRAIIMTGLYTDRKYRNEALDYFKVDDYVAKPLAVNDLIKLFKKHLSQDVQPTM